MHGVGVWLKGHGGKAFLAIKYSGPPELVVLYRFFFRGWRRRFSLLCLVVQSAASSTSRGWWSPAVKRERGRKEKAVVELNGQM